MEITLNNSREENLTSWILFFNLLHQQVIFNKVNVVAQLRPLTGQCQGKQTQIFN